MNICPARLYWPKEMQHGSISMPRWIFKRGLFFFFFPFLLTKLAWRISNFLNRLPNKMFFFPFQAPHPACLLDFAQNNLARGVFLTQLMTWPYRYNNK